MHIYIQSIYQKSAFALRVPGQFVDNIVKINQENDLFVDKDVKQNDTYLSLGFSLAEGICCIPFHLKWLHHATYRLDRNEWLMEGMGRLVIYLITGEHYGS